MRSWTQFFSGRNQAVETRWPRVIGDRRPLAQLGWIKESREARAVGASEMNVVDVGYAVAVTSSVGGSSLRCLQLPSTRLVICRHRRADEDFLGPERRDLGRLCLIEADFADASTVQHED
jgi:hypothetical protein